MVQVLVALEVRREELAEGAAVFTRCCLSPAEGGSDAWGAISFRFRIGVHGVVKSEPILATLCVLVFWSDPVFVSV